MRNKSIYEIFERIFYCLSILIFIGGIFTVWYIKEQSTHNYLPLYIRIFLTLLCVGVGIMFILENKNIWRKKNMRKNKEIEELKKEVKKIEEYQNYLKRKDIGTQIVSEYRFPFTNDVCVIYANDDELKEEKVSIYNNCYNELIIGVEVVKEDKHTILIKATDVIFEITKYNANVRIYYLSELEKLKFIVKELENETKNKQVKKPRKKPKVNTD